MKGEVSMNNYTQDGLDFMYSESLDNNSKNGFCDYRYEILYVISGEGSFCIEGSDVEFNSSSFFVIKPLTYYDIEVKDGTEFKSYSITFSPSDVHESILNSVDSLFSPNSSWAVIRDFAHIELERIFSCLPFADKLSGENKKQYLSSVLSQILILLSSAETKLSYSNSNEMISHLTDFILDNLDLGNVVSLDEIAKSFFVSKFYLCRIFKKHKGRSIHSYINQKRIMMAKQYIDSGISARDAAARVGYGDYSAFYRAYVKVVGQSPKSQKGE